MSLLKPTKENGKTNLDTGDKDIEIPTIRSSRQQTQLKKPPDVSIDHVSEDARKDNLETSAPKSRHGLNFDNKSSSPTLKSSIVSLSASSSQEASNCVMGESGFEDEHNAADGISAKPFDQSSSTPLDGGSTRYDDTATASFGTQQRQDAAFVQKFWTSYDEILILSLFTQVGILCRLAAAYSFRYFDNVFHSDSALFTVLPMNCLSCFVMGLLSSGESLMQIVSTRFTPPRLQQDLYRESSKQLQEFEEEEMRYENSVETENHHEEVNKLGTKKLKRRGWRRRQREHLDRSKNDDRSTAIRSNSLFRQHHQRPAQNPALYDELRDVQLLAWERRIRASVCLLLFPVKKEDVDIVENYFDDGYQKDRNHDLGEGYCEEEKIEDCQDIASARSTRNIDERYGKSWNHGQTTTGGFDDLIFEVANDDSAGKLEPTIKVHSSSLSVCPERLVERQVESEISERKICSAPNNQSSTSSVQDQSIDNHPEYGVDHEHSNVNTSTGQVESRNIIDHDTRENPEFDQILSNMATDVSNRISFIGRVNLANGWDVGTSPQEKSEDLTLGLRDGLCGALSSFSSWISSMVNLFRTGQIGKGFVGVILGIQLPLVAYRFGQHVSIYIFVWRCRREKRQDERRGYGIQLHTSDEPIFNDDFIQSQDSIDESLPNSLQKIKRTKGRRTVHDQESDVPSIRAIFTALFITCLVAQLTSLTFFKEPDDRLLALSLLFSPLGVLARWRMMKFNSWRPSFPLGTFACNVTACALSGTLGTLLAGNPDPRERIALVSIIAGFGGTLSSVARFIVEILSLMDPILFRLDGFYYAVISVSTGLLFSFLFSASVDWADSVG
mmetsp:Transcript_14357/g.33425  ORF Transcript_14357/g.33425 Transcript_14357/m.33425 type:complete len:841 (-) Transcript_14357:171-2693(-)